MKKLAYLCVFAALVSCGESTKKSNEKNVDSTQTISLVDKYETVQLSTDMDKLSDAQKQVISKLIEAAEYMDKLFWYEAYGNKDSLLSSIENPELMSFAMMNYGPWDRLNNNEPFIDGVGQKPAGANFYPTDMTKEEFESADLAEKSSLYTFLRRDESGNLITVPYHVQFDTEIKKVAALLKEAASIAENEAFSQYLSLRAEALLSDDYYASDVAWMEMKDNPLELVIGPIETYEDQLFGYKAAHEAFVLVKDMEWSERLSKYVSFLPELQSNLPVEEKYKTELPGSKSDLNAYDVVYYAGDCNAGSKTIAINLPNDERVQTKYGTRRLQLKNAMRAKFEKILLPISEVLVDPEQRKYITFDAFFANTMFHEVAHGLGIKNVIGQETTVREALKEHYSALEEGKADVLGLYMITQLHEKGELEGSLEEYYTTFMASIFRSVRFGASSSHGKANMIRFNYFLEKGAFSRSEEGSYKIDFDKMSEAMNDLSGLILQLQGDGDYQGVDNLVKSKGVVSEQLQADLDKLAALGIPVDLVFDQGLSALGLQ